MRVMKATKVELENGRTVITAETPRLFRKPKIRRFVASRQITKNYWDWLELPGKTTVDNHLSFQLDAWNREAANDPDQRPGESPKTL